MTILLDSYQWLVWTSRLRLSSEIWNQVQFSIDPYGCSFYISNTCAHIEVQLALWITWANYKRWRFGCIFGKPIWCHLCQIQLWVPNLPNFECCQRASRTHSVTFTSKLAFKSLVQLNMTRRPWMMNVRWKRNVKIKYVN